MYQAEAIKIFYDDESRSDFAFAVKHRLLLPIYIICSVSGERILAVRRRIVCAAAAPFSPGAPGNKFSRLWAYNIRRVLSQSVGAASSRLYSSEDSLCSMDAVIVICLSAPLCGARTAMLWEMRLNSRVQIYKVQKQFEQRCAKDNRHPLNSLKTFGPYFLQHFFISLLANIYTGDNITNNFFSFTNVCLYTLNLGIYKANSLFKLQLFATFSLLPLSLHYASN
jgi:hypothetical protein